MKVAVVVLNFNGTGDTLACLRSLAETTYDPVRHYVVDNGSDPPLRPDLEAADLPVTLLESPVNLGYTGGCNLGARRALADGADAVLLLNNDTKVEPGFIEPLVRALEGDPRLGIVTPKIYFHGQDRVLWAHGARIDRWTGRSPHIGVYEKDSGQHDHVREVDRVTGCAMMAPRGLIEDVGLLDDRFFMYSEEADWSLRARRAGWRLEVVKDSVVHHKGHRSSGKLGKPRIVRLRMRNHLLLLRKHSGYFVAGGAPALAWFVLAAARQALAGLATFDRRGLESAAAEVRGVVDFWLGRFGPPA